MFILTARRVIEISVNVGTKYREAFEEKIIRLCHMTPMESTLHVDNKKSSRS